MDSKLLEELSDILLLPKPRALAKLQEKKRQGQLASEDIELLLTEFLSATRIEPDGHKFGLHTQLARARFADDNAPCYDGRGTPPQRHSWSVADRRSEPIRRGSPEWFAEKRQLGGPSASESSPVTCSDNSDDEEEAAAPQTKWGRFERGRNSKERRRARTRCALGQPSSLRSSWSVASDDKPATVAIEGAENTGSKKVEESIDRSEESTNTVEDPVDKVEEAVDKVEESMNMVEDPVDKVEEAVEKVEEEMKKVEEPVYRVDMPVDMVANNSVPQSDVSGSEDRDRETTRTSWATTLRRWRDTIIWRC